MFNPDDFIGTELSDAVSKLAKQGFKVVVDVFDGGKIDNFDTELVTGAVLKQGTVYLTATRFLLRI